MSTTQQNALNASVNPSETLRTSATIYLSLLGAGLVVFEGLRHRFPRAYASRQGGGGGCHGSGGGPNGRGWWPPWGWIPRVLRVSDDELFEHCGLDTLCFLRFLRLGQRLTLVAIGLSAVLLPLYATATPPKTARAHIDPLERLTLANVAVGDRRLWASTAAAYVLTAVALRELLREYQCYVRRRHELLARADAPMYTVLINDLPLRLRTAPTLEAYMRKLFPNTLRGVYVAVECRKLEQLVEERENVRSALEHALVLSERRGGRPRHREGPACGCRRGRTVDSIDFYQERLAKLNGKVAREISSIEAAQVRLAQEVQDAAPGDLSELVIHPTASAMAAAAAVAAASPTDRRPNAGSHLLARHLQSPQRRPASPAGNPKVAVEVPDEDNEEEDEAMRTQQRHDDDDVRERSRQLQPIRVMRRAAFISFTSLMAAQVAQQTLQASHPTSMIVTPAPHVDDVHWPNVGHSFRVRALGRLASSLLTAVIVLFWTVPTAFVASLSSVESLRRALPFLNQALDEYPALEDAFKQIAPLALLGLTALSRLVFALLSEREGHASYTEARASTFTKLVFFQLLQVFFVTVIVGTVMDSLKVILDQPKILIAMLGSSMPQQSTFFMSYVLLLTGLSLTLELLRVVPLLYALLFRCFAPTLTRRERAATCCGLSLMSTTEPFDPTTVFADAFLVMLVTLTFATVAPLVCYITGAFFVVADVVYRRQVLYVYRASRFAMGAYWPRLYRFMIAALVVAQLTLLGLLSLRQAAVPFVFVIVLIVATLLFDHYVGTLYPRAARHLPLMDCVRIDDERRQQQQQQQQPPQQSPSQHPEWSFLDNVYRQPAMSQRHPIRPDYRMLQDSDGDDHDDDDDDPHALVLSPETEDQRLVMGPSGAL